MGWYKAAWDRKDGKGTCEGWVNLTLAEAVERRGRERLTDFGMTVIEPVAVVTLAGGVVVTVTGYEASRLFRTLDASALLTTRLTPPEGADGDPRVNRWDRVDQAG